MPSIVACRTDCLDASDYNGFFSAVDSNLQKFSSRLALLHLAVTACFLLGAANGIGWVFDIPLLVSLFESLPKMVPATATLVLASAASLGLQARHRVQSPAGSAIGMLVALAGLSMLACHIAGTAPSPFLLSGVGTQSALSLSAPLTAGIFFILGGALSLMARDRHVELAQIGAMAVLLLRPDQGIMTVIAGSSPSARIARRLLWLALAVPLVLAGIAVAALHAGLYDAATLLPLLAWGTIVLLALLIWRFAWRLYELDIARARAEQDLTGALQQLHDERDRKDVFLAMLAHELRNPLAPIQSAAELLRHMRNPDRAGIDKVGSMILRQVEHMVHLVDDLLDVSRIGRGQLVLDAQPVDIRAAINAACEQVRPAIERKRHHFQLDLAPEPLAVLGDHKRMVQIIANLLNNAAKYTPEGGELALRLTADARQVTIAVRDNGIGIDAALLPRVFDTFTQATLTPDRQQGGLGLGLALVKRLSELHGGTVEVESAGAGAGSTFTLVLPRA